MYPVIESVIGLALGMLVAIVSESQSHWLVISLGAIGASLGGAAAGFYRPGKNDQPGVVKDLARVGCWIALMGATGLILGMALTRMREYWLWYSLGGALLAACLGLGRLAQRLAASVRERMSPTTPATIVRKAIRRNELDLLLLGEPGYRYLGRWPVAPGNTDLTLLLSALYQIAQAGETEMIKNLLLKAIDRITDSYEGVVPVAECILYEVGHVARKQFSLGLPLHHIANELKIHIRLFYHRLLSDKTREGTSCPDGRFGVLMRLSDVTVGLGGPAFVDELTI